MKKLFFILSLFITACSYSQSVSNEYKDTFNFFPSTHDSTWVKIKGHITGMTELAIDSSTRLGTTAFIKRAIAGVRGPEILNVRDFGALGDGTTNDGAAFRAWAAALSAGNKVGIVPRSNSFYLSTDSIEITGSNITILLEGNIRFNFSTPKNGIYVHGSSGAYISNVNIIGNGSWIDHQGQNISWTYATGPGYSTILYRFVNNGSVTNVHAMNGLVDCIKMLSCYKPVVRSCVVSGSVNDNGLSMIQDPEYFAEGIDTTYTNGLIENCIAYNNRDFGITVFGARNCRVNNSVAYQNGHDSPTPDGGGFSDETNPGAGTLTGQDERNNTVWTNCYGYRNYTNNLFVRSKKVAIYNFIGDSVLGTPTESYHGAGITILGSTEFIIDGGKLSHGWYGVRIHNDILVYTNGVIKNVSIDTNRRQAIFAEGTTYTEVTGNSFNFNNTSQSGAAEVHIANYSNVIEASASAVISNNSFKNTNKRCVQLNDIKYSEISGNSIYQYDYASYPLAIQAAWDVVTSGTIANNTMRGSLVSLKHIGEFQEFDPGVITRAFVANNKGNYTSRNSVDVDDVATALQNVDYDDKYRNKGTKIVANVDYVWQDTVSTIIVLQATALKTITLPSPANFPDRIIEMHTAFVTEGRYQISGSWVQSDFVTSEASNTIVPDFVNSFLESNHHYILQSTLSADGNYYWYEVSPTARKKNPKVRLTFDAAVTITAQDDIVILNSTANNIVATLPAPSDTTVFKNLRSKTFTIRHIKTANNNTVNVSTPSGSIVSSGATGATFYTIRPYGSTTLSGNGANWYVVNKYDSANIAEAGFIENQNLTKQVANSRYDTSQVLKLRADSIRNINGHLDIRTGSNNLNLTGYDVNIIGTNAVIFNGSVRNDGTSGYSAKHATGINYTSIVFTGGAASYTASFPAKTGTVAFLDDITGGGGEANTASNLGGGLANYSTKVGVDLRFNSFAAADFDLASNLISIDATKWLTQSSAASTYIPYGVDVNLGSNNLLTTGNVQGISKSPNSDLFDLYDFDDNNIVRFSNPTAFRANFDFNSLTANSAITFPNVAAGTVVYNDNTATLTNKSIVATQLTGTIADARLSANVGLLNAIQDYTGLKAFAPTLTNASAYAPGLVVAPTANQSGTGKYRALWIPVYEQNPGGTPNYLISAGLVTAPLGGGTYTEKFLVDNAGNTTIAGTLNVALNTGLAGTVTLTGLSNTGAAPTNILNMSSGVVGFRTLAQTLTDLGAVPYTGATANLVMGSFALQGLHVSNDANDFDLRGSASNVLMKVQNTAGFQPTLNFNGLSTGRIYTAPNAAGTWVLETNTATLTNKTIDAGSNTITGLTNTNLSGTAGITNANLASGIDAAKITTGTLPTAQTAALTGDVTKSAGSNATTIANDAVTFAKFQNLSSYTFPANNTGSAADAAEHVFKDIAEQTYSGTITWTGTTAPSGTLIQNYQWTQVGKMVTIRVNLSYSVAGSAVSAVTLTLPSDCPTPKEPTGFVAANEYMYTGSGGLSTATTTQPSTNGKGYLGVNASDNGYLIIIIAGAAQNSKIAEATITYWIP